MIEIGGKRWRNLQEQVAWLTAMIGQATDVVKNVQGTVAAAADLPDASTFSNGTTYAVGSASPYEYYVAINGTWLDIGAFPQAGPAGADGVNGVSIFMTSFPTTSATTAIPVISVYNPDGRPVVHGLILSEQGDVFVVTAVNSIGTYDVTYRCSIKGPQGAQGPAGAAGAPGAQGPAGADGADGAPGADGATWKAGSAVIHVDGSGGAFVIPVSSYTGAKVGDFYLSTSTYTSDGYTINKGDVWIITNMTVDGNYGILSRSANIEGPQGDTGATGADGADGATWYSGTDVIHTGGSGGAYVIPLSSLPDLKVGDLYLVTSTYTSDGETLNNGDVWAVYNIADPYAVMTRRTNIEGPSVDDIIIIPFSGASGSDFSTTGYTKNSLIAAIQSGKTVIVNWHVNSSTDLHFVLSYESSYVFGSIISMYSGGSQTCMNIIINSLNNIVLNIYNLPNVNSVLTTQGDLITKNQYGVLAKIGLGTAGQVLTVNAAGTNPEWQTPSGGGGGGASIGGGFLLDCSCSTGIYTGSWEALILGSYSGTYGWHHVSQNGADMDTLIDGTAIGSLDFSMTNVSLIVFKTAPSGGDFDEITGTMYCDGVALSKANVTQYAHKLAHLESDVYLSWED